MPKDGLDSQKGTQRGPTKLKAYLICYIPSPFFPAHWSLWVAYGVGYTGPGTRIHVIGNALNGFQHDLDREYNPASDDRHPRVIDLGVIDESLLSPKAPGGIPAEGTSVDKSGACNALEHLALRIPAPGPSLRSSGSNAGRPRVHIQNCQTWLRLLVGSLTEQGMISQEAQRVVDTAPQH